MKDLIHIRSISQVHELLGYSKPKHPLITLINFNAIEFSQICNDIQVVSDLYSITLKDNPECQFRYGRQSIDFQEGSLFFIAADQSITFGPSSSTGEENTGWMLFFHPDLVRKTQLSAKMSEYTFFSYTADEALHLSEEEKMIVNRIVETIEHESDQNIDEHSQELIVSNLELLLNYSKRFFGRQFLTRTNTHKDILLRFESLLQDYFISELPGTMGLPSVKYCAKELGYSPNYLSDLLKKETGKNTSEHIHFTLVEKAKNMLLGSEDSISEISYALGFQYPQHFSKFFKNKTGMSPASYRV